MGEALAGRADGERGKRGGTRPRLACQGLEDLAERALERALELFDLTRGDPKNAGRRREPARVRELFLDFFPGGNRHASTEEAWRRYFTAFARLARHVIR